MKAKQHISATLIALIFASVSIQAQSARPSGTLEKREVSKATRTSTRETTSHKAKSIQPERNVQARQVRTQQTRTTQSARKPQSQQVRTQQTRTTQSARHTRKPVSMTTTKNPRSTYRKANSRLTAEPRYNPPVKSKKYHSRNYYGGNHYHYAYPTRNVKINYHHDTYINHYHVLYYPSYGDIYWTRNMYRDYHRWYPEFHWRYNYGHRIQTISVFDAQYNLGEVAMVYGRVYASWHNKETDDFLLFFGGDFPYQQFTVVIPGFIARKFSWRPERYFLGEHITINGLITTFDGSPEIVVKNKRQLGLY
jgi:hypothetical protein